MTTAHRPTFNPAVGGTGKNEGDLSKLSKQYSSRDMPSHTKLKYRQTGQGSTDELKNKDFRRELEEREKTSSKDKRGGREAASSGAASAGSLGASTSSKKPRLDQLASSAANLDADDPVDDDEEREEDDEDEDDTAELMAELARIKKEREAERAKAEAAKKAEEEQIRTESILHGNPLLSGQVKQDFKVKRRWDDDVVFKNCAKGQDDKKKEQTFINDALRSEFHKKFMEKYIK